MLDRLREAEAELDDPDAPLYAWGFDPIYYPGDRLSASDLDTVSATRPKSSKTTRPSEVTMTLDGLMSR